VKIIPVSLKDANAFVAKYHRHHKPVVGHKFSIGLELDGEIVGVAIIGRPVARHRDDGRTMEVTRLCTNGAKNACSKLYAAAWRACRAMGYTRLGTYILDSESGTSLRAAGWKELYKTQGGSWNRKKRPRIDKHPLENKTLFEMSI
jgi:hypothetical protein